MIIHRVLNNNVVIILDSDGDEQVVCGKGIAFRKKAGDELDESLINQTFVLKDKQANNFLQQLLSEIPFEIVELCNQIIEYATLQFGKKLKDNLLVSLSDHINSSMNNFKDGITIKNVMIWDIKRFYEREFAIGEKALEMINEKFGVQLSIDEAGFIALHIVNAEMDGEDLEQTVNITKMMQEITNMVKYHFAIEYDTDSIHYYRFITHIKFFSQRVISGKSLPKEADNQLYEMVKTNYKAAYACTEKLEDFIEKKYGYTLTNDDKLYLMIHINRITMEK